MASNVNIKIKEAVASKGISTMRINLLKKMVLSVLLVVITTSAASTFAGPGFDGSYLTEYRGGVNTPHTKLASPYAMGKPNVLFLLCKDLGEGQEVKELAQRADLNIDVLFFKAPAEIGGKGMYYSQAMGVSPQEKEEALIEKLSRPFDVIVLGSVLFEGLPPSCKYLLLEKFRKGTGLVIMRYRKSFKFIWKKSKIDKKGIEYITNGMPYEGLFSWAKGWYNYRTGNKTRPLRMKINGKWKIFPKGAPFESGMLAEHVLCFDMGRSRLVTIEDYETRRVWRNQTALFSDIAANDAISMLGMRKELDIHSTVFIKSIYWAANMEARASIVGLPLKTVRIKANEKTIQELKFTYGDKAPKDGYQLRWNINDKLGKKVADGFQKLNGRQKELKLNLPSLRASGFFLNLTLESDKKIVEDWGSIYIQATSPVKFGDIKCDKEFYETNQTVRGTVNATDASKVKVTLIDRHNRDISSGTFTAKNGKATFSLSLNDTESMRIAITAGLLDKNGVVIAETMSDIFVSQMRENDFMMVMWPRSHNQDTIFITNYKTLADELGVNGVVYNGVDLTLSNMSDIQRWHWVGRYMKDVNDPKALKKNLDKVRESTATARKMSRRTHLLGDEVKVGCELSKHGLNVWREWLKKDYKGDIAALNSTWKSNYPSFAEIPVFNKEEIKKYEQDNFPRYLDLKRFAQINTAEFVGKAREITRPTSPHTLVGLQYLSLFNNDAESFARNMNLVSTASPTDPTLKLMRDMCEPGSVFGGWTGGYMNQRHEYRRLIWSNLLNGCNSLWLFTEIGSEGMLACDGRVTDYVKWVLPDYQAVVNGFGQFVMQAKRLDAKVAVLHDYRSVVGGTRFNKLSRYNESHKVFDKILNNAGIQYHYIGGRELEEGILAKEKFKTLLLPFTTCITKKQADKIKLFVKNGGTLIADIAPGVMNGHGKIAVNGMLSDVFGVNQNPVNETINGKVSSSVGIHLPFAMAMPNAKATTAKPMGTVATKPAFYKNRFGKGTAWLLNFSPLAFGDLAEIGEEAQCAKAFGKLFNVKPLLRFEDGEGNPLPGMEIFNIFELGGRKMLGILPSQDIRKTDKAIVLLPKKWYVTNSLTGEYYGYVDKILLGSVKRYQPLIFDLSPVKISGIGAKFASKPTRGKITDVAIKLKGRKNGADIVHYELRGPDGGKCSWFIGNFTLSNGKGTLKLPVAENEKAGEYTLVITDVLSRKSCKSNFVLEK